MDKSVLEKMDFLVLGVVRTLNGENGMQVIINVWYVMVKKRVDISIVMEIIQEMVRVNPLVVQIHNVMN